MQHLIELTPEQLQWINRHTSITHYAALCGDAGFRRYFRLYMPTQTVIFMDASEEPLIYQAFIAQTQHLSQYALPIPKLLAQENAKSWAIIEDFGDDLLFHVLQPLRNALPLAQQFYQQAIDHLIVMHACPVKAFGRIAVLDEKVMLEELEGWQTWCLEKLFARFAKPQSVNTQSLRACFDKITKKVAEQPYVFMHRDFHSKNLLRKSNDTIGIIDYQDAMLGPMTYDLASLLRDCYIDWPEADVVTWALYYKQQAQSCGLLSERVSDEEFLVWFDWTSIQRHLKALFTFSRKFLRDHDDRYLQFLPRTLHYLENISSRYQELNVLTAVIHQLRENYHD